MILIPPPLLLLLSLLAVCPFESKKDLADGLHRRRYTALDVLYFMKAKKPNIMKLIDDYKQDAAPPPPDLLERFFPCILKGIPDVDKEPTMYADCRLLVVPGPSQRPGLLNWELMHNFLQNQIENRGYELQRLQTAYKDDSDTKECIVEVMAYESSMFSLDMPDTLSNTYPHALVATQMDADTVENERHRVLDQLVDIAHRFASAALAVNEYPHVRYVQSSRGVAEHVARSLVAKFREFRDTHPNFQPWGDNNNNRNNSNNDDNSSSSSSSNAKNSSKRSGSPNESAVVLVLDRVDDLVPALLHDVTYQSLVSDLLDHEPTTPFKHTYNRNGIKITKDVMLDETDPVWRLIRNDDMGTAMEALEDAWKVIAERKEARSKLDRNDPGDLRELMSVLAGDEKLVEEKVALHYRISSRIVEAYEQLNLQDVMTLEQVLVTGCDSEGTSISTKKVETELRQMLSNSKLNSMHKTRLLLIWLICNRNIDNRTKQDLISIADLDPEDKSAILNVPDLHIPANRTSSEPRAEGAPFFDDTAIARNKKMAKEVKKLCRYIPKAEEIVKNLIEDTLSEDAYPWVRAPPAQSNGKDGNGKNGGAAAYDARNLEPMMAMNIAHGEVVNRFTAAAMQAGPNDTSNAKSRATKKSRFTKDGDANSNVGNSSGSGSSNANPGDAILNRYLEPVKPKYYQGSRIFVFFIGGVTQLEMAALDKLSKETNREIIVGGTSIVTPRDFLEQLTLTDPDSGKDDNDRGLGTGIGDMLKGSGIEDF